MPDQSTVIKFWNYVLLRIYLVFEEDFDGMATPEFKILIYHTIILFKQKVVFKPVIKVSVAVPLN